ncbi:MAG: hypothetical protein ACOCUT_03550 [bacterium]
MNLIARAKKSRNARERYQLLIDKVKQKYDKQEKNYLEDKELMPKSEQDALTYQHSLETKEYVRKLQRLQKIKSPKLSRQRDSLNLSIAMAKLNFASLGLLQTAQEDLSELEYATINYLGALTEWQ